MFPSRCMWLWCGLCSLNSDALRNVKEDFCPNPLFLEPVEMMCDFIEAHGDGKGGLFTAPTPPAAVRALWYCFACWTPPVEKKGKKKSAKEEGKPFDPYAESERTAFDVDVRDLRNTHIVASALLMYLSESRESLVAEDAYNDFITSNVATASSVTALVHRCAPHQVRIIHRIALLLAALVSQAPADKSDEVRRTLAQSMGPALFRAPGASEEHNKATSALRGEGGYQLLVNMSHILPKAYEGSATRVAQALHYKPQVLRANEWAILAEAGEKVSFSGGAAAIESNTENSDIFQVVDGHFAVYVGTTKVATLVAGDWFGEMSLLGNHFSKARVLSEKRSVALRIPEAKLNAVLLARPDLAAGFYSVLAFDLASRLKYILFSRFLLPPLLTRPLKAWHWFKVPAPSRTQLTWPLTRTRVCMQLVSSLRRAHKIRQKSPSSCTMRRRMQCALFSLIASRRRLAESHIKDSFTFSRHKWCPCIKRGTLRSALLFPLKRSRR